jgi:hypothetical protein
VRLGNCANLWLGQVRGSTERAVCLLVGRVDFNLMHGRHDLGGSQKAVEKGKLEVRYSDRPDQTLPV